MNFFYKIYDALCVNIFEYIFHWRTTKITATDSSKINTFNEKVGLTSRTYWQIIPWQQIRMRKSSMTNTKSVD